MPEPKKTEPKPAAPEFFVVADPDNVPVTFVSQVVAAGHLNGVVNLTLAVARFSPNAGGAVDPDMAVAARLRCDMACAAQLYEQLGRILNQAQAQAQVLASTVLATTAGPGRSGKSN